MQVFRSLAPHLSNRESSIVNTVFPRGKHYIAIDRYITHLTIHVTGGNVDVINPAGLPHNITQLDNLSVSSWAIKQTDKIEPWLLLVHDGDVLVSVTGKSLVDVHVGFAVKKTENLEETNHRPIKGRNI